jgi:hypothetical protein
MPKLICQLLDRFPLQFRVLYRQFLLRVIDLEALSIQADIPRFLGQFASVLIIFSVIEALGLLIHPVMTPAALFSMAWRTEQSLISSMMLAAGLIAVISWDNIFPDRRDVMVLSPLPVAPPVILFAKVAASGAVLGLAVLSLNFASGLALPLVLGGIPRFPRVLAAYWFTMIAASLFLYCAVLTAQGFTALLLPRRLFLRVSALLQLAAFGLCLGTYFIQPVLDTPAAFAAKESQRFLDWSPSFWFFALFNQLSGSLPPNFAWMARRAWLGLAIVVCGPTASLLLCYLRTMKKTVEDPDLVSGGRGWHWAPHLGSSLITAIVLFSVRSLTRSRHHRVAFAFYLSIVFAIALSSLKAAMSTPTLHRLTPNFLMSTLVMVCLAVVGLRSVFALPISLNANWVLRVTQLYPSEKYIAAARHTLILLAVLPVWLCAALLSLCFRPLHQSAAHLVVLALVGFIMTELSLIGVSKIPFACSYLPGKSNIQYMFWGFVVIFFPIAKMFANYEQRTLHLPLQYAGMISALTAVALELWVFNRHHARSAVLYYEELPPEVITTLGLSYW